MTWEAPPDFYVLVVLALAAFRTTRLVGWDTLTAGFRVWLTGWTDDGHRKPSKAGWPARRLGLRTKELRIWLSCPWCAGAWHSALSYLAWLAWSDTIVVAALAAISSIVGLVGKHLDA